jgi:hypothetical protein
MGYSHYCYKSRELDQTKWDNFITDFEKVLPFFEQYLDKDISDNQYLQYNSEKLWFNGIGEESHETFAFARVEPKDGSTGYGREDTNTPYFMFCKTARKDYDIAVTCALIIAKYHFEDDVVVSSDGGNEEWEAAKELCQDELEYGEKFIFPPYRDGGDDNGAFFNECNECDGEGCIDCIKPCEANTHEFDDDPETFNHPTGEGEWAKCSNCGYGIQRIWHTEYVGERITKADDRNAILEDLR